MPRQKASLDLDKVEVVAAVDSDVNANATQTSTVADTKTLDKKIKLEKNKPDPIDPTENPTEPKLDLADLVAPAVNKASTKEVSTREEATQEQADEKSVEDFIGSPVSSAVGTTDPAPSVKEEDTNLGKSSPASVMSKPMVSRPIIQRLITRTPSAGPRMKSTSWSNPTDRAANDRAWSGSSDRSANERNMNMNDRYSRPEKIERDLPTSTIRGILDDSRDGHGVLRIGFAEDDRDAYISSSQIRRFKLRSGDVVEGPVRAPKEGERYWGLLKVDKVNDVIAEEFLKLDRVKFKSLTPVYPDEQIKLETGEEPLSLRIIDMIAPIGKGQRSLIVSPPKAGKTTLLKNIASGVASNTPDIHLMAVLVGERPEEVTDIRRHIEAITKGRGEVAASNFDESAADQVRVAELALERAKRLVEAGKDVVILLDSITRLARAYNLAMPTSGRTLSGGFDPAALFPPKKFFGAARNFEIQGSLTIVGTALIDTGSRMDDLIYEEFKGTGNQEVHLSRHLAERRIHPAIDVQRSGTRRDELLISQANYQAIATLHRMLDTIEDRDERTVTLISQLKKAGSNKEFLASIKGG